MLDQIFIALPLNKDELLKAARLGGLAINLNTDLTDADDQILHLISDYAREGLYASLATAFDLEYPTYYPDDVIDELEDDSPEPPKLLTWRAAE